MKIIDKTPFLNDKGELGISQREAARRMEVAIGSLVHWELGETGLDPTAYPKIIYFLGYNPLSEPKSRGEAVKRERLSRGLSIRGLAALAGVAADTICRLEADAPSMASNQVRAVPTPRSPPKSVSDDESWSQLRALPK